MLEVLSAAFGTGTFGAFKGYLSRTSSHPWRGVVANSLIAGLCLFEIDRRATRGDDRSQGWSALIDDRIDSNTPKYFLQNIPLLVASFSASFAVTAAVTLMGKRPRVEIIKWLERR